MMQYRLRENGFWLFVVQATEDYIITQDHFIVWKRTSYSLSSSLIAYSEQRSVGSCGLENQTISYFPSTASHPSSCGCCSIKGWFAADHILAMNADRFRWTSSALQDGRLLASIPLSSSNGFFNVAGSPKALSNDFHIAELILLSEGSTASVLVQRNKEKPS